MKVIDRSKYQSPDGNINYWDRMQGFMAYGSTWYRDAQAQQEIMGQLARVLDNRFVLLRNIVLPGTDVPIPLILAGPTGIWVMLVNGMRGVYRAKSDAWLTMDGGRFKAAKPNRDVAEILIPGETRWHHYERQMKEGIELDRKTIESLSGLAKDMGISTPW